MLRKLVVISGIIGLLVNLYGCIGPNAKEEIKHVSEVRLSVTSASINVMEEIVLNAEVIPENAENKKINWSSSDENTATVNSAGVVTGIRGGKVTITAISIDGNKTAFSKINVMVPVEGIAINITSGSIAVGDEIILNAEVFPDNADNKKINWNSADESIATVDENGKIKGLKAGTTTISGITADGNKTAQFIINILTGFRINFITASSDKIDINYLETGREWKKGIAMKKMSENKGSNIWYCFVEAVNPIEFYFNNAGGDIISLGKVIMAGADGFGSEPQENFKTNCKEIWVKDGACYTYNPLIMQKSSDEIVVLTINLHTYQESTSTQSAKFDRVVSAIADLDADIVMLQECAQNKNATDSGIKVYGNMIRVDNMAKIITDRLKEKGKNYNYFWDWEHYGWSVWEEGTAVLTKYDITKTESRYVSKSTSTVNVNSRKPVMIEVDIPGVGKTAVFSAHTGWWNAAEEPFQTHFTNIDKWIDEVMKNDGIENFFLAGDFNIEASKEGYNYVMNLNKYNDNYYLANPNGFMDATIGGNIAGWESGDPYGKRIDYIFTNKGNKLTVKMSQRIFTEKSYGRVSDHNGQYAVFSLNK